MENKQIHASIRTISLALNACHNTVATDRIDAEPDEYSWVIDNSKELQLLDELEKFICTQQKLLK